MSDNNNLRKGYFDYHHQKDLNKLVNYNKSGNEIEDVRLNLRDCTGLRDVLKTFQNVKTLECVIWNYTEDIKKEVPFPNLTNVHFGKLIPMNLKNFWKVFSNLKEVSILNRDNYDLFTSQFVNRVIGRNEKTLKVLRILDVAVVASTYKPLRVPCQLEELEIIYCTENSQERICRSQEYEQKRYDKQKFMKQPGLVFYTKQEEITSFDNLTEILRSQDKLKSLTLDNAVIDSEILDIIVRKPHIRDLKLTCSEFLFEDFDLHEKEFLSKIRKLFISHVPENSTKGLREILNSIKNVEFLEIHCVWHTVGTFEIPETKISLPHLKEFKMYMNSRSNEILDTFEFSEKLEKITVEIGSVEKAEAILRTSPNITNFNLETSSSEEIANFVVTKFKKLEWFEWTVSTFCFQTAIFILENASNIKRSKIYLYTECTREEEQSLVDKVQSDFPGFFFDYRGCVLEIHNTELDFKLRIGYHHYMLGGNW